MNTNELYEHLQNATYRECMAIKRNAGPHSPYVTDQRLADLLESKLRDFERWGITPQPPIGEDR